VVKTEKEEQVKEITEKIRDNAMIFFNYQGVKVCDLTFIRNEIRKNGGSVTVVKNTYLRRALMNLDIDAGNELCKGMLAVAAVRDDISQVGKILLDADSKSLISIKGGFFSGSIITSEYVKKLAKIPSRNVLLSMLVGCLQNPINNFASVLSAIAAKKE